MNAHDETTNRLFEAAMKSSGVSASDTRMVKDIATHATSEALKRMMAIADTAPDAMQGYVLIASIAMLKGECDRQIGELVNHLKGQIS